MKRELLYGILLLFTAGLLFGCVSADSDESQGSEVEEELMSSMEESDINQQNGDDTMTVAVFDTSMGSFELELFTKEMPITTGNFIKLAQEGFYDGTRFHRVIANFMIQGGDPLSADTSKRNMWGTGGPGYAIEDEHVSGAKLSNTRGTISMANSGPNSGGSQFFINVVDNSYLDWDKQPASSKHPVFGEVVLGMSVVDAIVSSDVGARDQPVEDIVVNSVTIREG